MNLSPEMEQFLATFRENPNYIVEVTEREGHPSVFIIHKATLKRFAGAEWDDEAANASIWKKAQTMNAQEAQVEVERLWGPITAVDRGFGNPDRGALYCVYHNGQVLGEGCSWDSAIADAKRRHPPMNAQES